MGSKNPATSLELAAGMPATTRGNETERGPHAASAFIGILSGIRDTTACSARKLCSLPGR